MVYANGQVPLSDPNIDPVALTTFAALPAPNIPGAALTAANFQYLPASTTTDDKGDAPRRLHPATRNRTASSATASAPSPSSSRRAFPAPPAATTTARSTRERGSLPPGGTGWSATTPSSNSASARPGRRAASSPPTSGQPNFLAGIPNVPQDPSYTGGLNTQTVSGFTQFGEQATNPQFTNPTQANPKVNYTWIKGHHSLKVGYEYGWLSQAISDFHPKFGSDTYAGSFSSAGSATTPQAANLTDFLFGARNNYSLNAVNEVNYLRYWHTGYVQDDWKALPNLTLNLGVRYEFMSPNSEQDNKLLNFDPVNNRLLHAGTGTDVNSTAPGHIYNLHYVGGSGLANRGLVNPDYKDFAPRVGFAWQPRPDTVVRGGYGISYAYLFRFGGEGLLAYNGPNNYSATLPVNQTPGQGICSSLTQDPTTCFRRTQDGYQTNFAGPTNFSTTKAQTRYMPEELQERLRAGLPPFGAAGTAAATDASRSPTWAITRCISPRWKTSTRRASVKPARSPRLIRASARHRCSIADPSPTSPTS